MKNNIIKLNESQLNKIIAESVKKVLSESEPWNEEPRQKPRKIKSSLDPDNYDYAPSDEEETFENELYSVIDAYGTSLAQQMGKKEFIKWCVEIIEKAI